MGGGVSGGIGMIGIEFLDTARWTRRGWGVGGGGSGGIGVLGIECLDTARWVVEGTVALE